MATITTFLISDPRPKLLGGQLSASFDINYEVDAVGLDMVFDYEPQSLVNNQASTKQLPIDDPASDLTVNVVFNDELPPNFELKIIGRLTSSPNDDTISVVS